MEKTMLKINYRTLSGGEHSPWLQTSTLDEIVWGGAYELMFASDDGSHGLPFRFTQDEKVTLIVNDNNKGNTHGMHTIVQRLTYVEHATCDLVTYTRTRCCCKGTNAWGEWSVLDGATTSMLQDGSVTAHKLSTDVREKVDNPLRPLFIAAGAEYNDTGADKTKTAPWGETVTHKAGHYYLNGLGDITEEQMMEIYNEKDSIAKLWQGGFANYSDSIRTFFPIAKKRLYDYKASVNVDFAKGLPNLETIVFNTYSNNSNDLSSMFKIDRAIRLFAECLKLKYVGYVNVADTLLGGVIGFQNCSSLEYVNIVNLKLPLSLEYSPLISKQSILQMIFNASPTSAIIITLHPDAYTRLADDADVIAALETQPLVSLVSA